MEFIDATYEFKCPEGDALARAEALLLEQTVETPRSVALRYPYVREHRMGEVRRVDRLDEQTVRAVLALPFTAESNSPAQFLNVLYGNSSLHPDVSLVDVEPPPSIRAILAGPSFGIAGLRRLVGDPDRPLTCGALKPNGLDVDELAAICRELAEGAIDFIKDDHYLTDDPRAPFRERVRACLAVVDDVSARTGRAVVYIPNLSGSPDEIRSQAEFAQQCGVGAVMFTPMLHGLPQLRALCERELDVPVFAHPSFGGSVSIRPPVLLGKLFRLFGADASIFPNYGGRFGYSEQTCAAIAGNLRAPWRDLAPAFPVPAGGMSADRADELVQFFGRDTILLVGGSLLASESVRERTKQFTERVRKAAELAASTSLKF